MFNSNIQKVWAAYGEQIGTTGGGLYNPLGADNITAILNRAIDIGMNLFTVIFVIMVIYAAFQMLFSRGKPEGYKGGISTLKWAIFGYAAIWCAWGIVKIIQDLLGAK